MPCIRLLRARQLGGLASGLWKGFARISSQEVLGSGWFRDFQETGTERAPCQTGCAVLGPLFLEEPKPLWPKSFSSISWLYISRPSARGLAMVPSFKHREKLAEHRSIAVVPRLLVRPWQLFLRILLVDRKREHLAVSACLLVTGKRHVALCSYFSGAPNQLTRTDSVCVETYWQYDLCVGEASQDCSTGSYASFPELPLTPHASGVTELFHTRAGLWI